MSTGNFQMTGPGINVRYATADDTLTVSGGGDSLSEDGKSFSGKEIARMKTAFGELLTVTLLESSRDGTAVRLAVLTPAAVLTEDGEHPITGVAILTRDRRHVVGGAPPVRHSYDTRPLTGQLWR